MKNLFHTLWVFLVISSCTNEEKTRNESYPVRDYRTVKLYLDTLNQRLQQEFDSTGTWKIQYSEFENGKKHLIFFGASHVRDVTHPQFNQLAAAFNKLNPQIAFNEGGQIGENVKYPTIDSAVHANGESGELKYLCDSLGISMMNGDMDDKEEFSALQKTIPQDQIYLYMAIERFLDGYRKGYFPGIPFEKAWNEKFISYLDKADFKLSPEMQSYDSLKKIYKHYLHKDLSLDSLEEVYEYYLTNDGTLGDVGRATKMVRDQALLKKIDQALDQYDRVFIVFGGSHRIAVDPALKQIINRKRN